MLKIDETSGKKKFVVTNRFIDELVIGEKNIAKQICSEYMLKDIHFALYKAGKICVLLIKCLS